MQKNIQSFSSLFHKFSQMWLRGDALLCSLGQGPHAQRSKRVYQQGGIKLSLITVFYDVNYVGDYN